jgi:putative FmdB family regulatory protein
MPHYDYKCSQCNHEEEVFQKITDEKLKVCPSCNNETFNRALASGLGLHFKGSGFYATDYQNK